MASGEVDLHKLHDLGSMSADEMGGSEEDVKIHFVVPLLHALGHTRLRFEHKGMDVVIKDGLPRGSTVVIEVKRPDENLDRHLAQLERYSFEERSLLSLLTNGRQLRIYAPFWNRAKTFPETLLWEFERGDLAEDRHANAIASLLSREALVGKWTLAALQERESVIETAWASAEALQQKDVEHRRQIDSRLGEIDRQIAQLQAERGQRLDELAAASPRTLDKIRALFRVAGVPIVPNGEFAYLAEGTGAQPPEGKVVGRRPVPKSMPREWSDDELYKNATTYQRRVFAGFVSLGQRTVALKELAVHVGLSPHSTVTAFTSFRRLSTRWGRDTLIEVERTSAGDHAQRGHIYSIAPRYWPVIQRLYRKEAP